MVVMGEADNGICRETAEAKASAATRGRGNLGPMRKTLANHHESVQPLTRRGNEPPQPMRRDADRRAAASVRAEAIGSVQKIDELAIRGFGRVDVEGPGRGATVYRHERQVAPRAARPLELAEEH